MKHKIITGIAVIAALCMQIVSSAQTMQTPLNADQPLVVSPTLINGINTAMIDVSCSDVFGFEQLMACAYYGSGGPGGIAVKDFVSLLQINIPYPPGLIAYCPDIILGDNTQLPGGADYIMAMAFIDNLGNVDIDFYDIHYTGPGIFTVTFHSRLPVPPVAGWTPYRTVHIDGVADHTAASGACGFPVCDKFFVTFDVFNVGMCGCVEDVEAAYGSLSSYSLIVPPTRFEAAILFNYGTFTATHSVDNGNPDVAGVQLLKGPGGPVDDVARITWTSQGYPGGGLLFEADWDPFGATSGVVFHPYGAYAYFSPRIDANDDYLTNSSSLNANYKIAAQTFSGGPATMLTFDNTFTAAPASFWMNTAGFLGTPPSYNTYLPAVAFGPDNSTQYMVTSMMENIPAFGDYVMMEPIDQSLATVLATDPSLLQSYFLVDNQITPINSVPCNYANSVSTPCNNVADMSVVAWAYFDGINYLIDYKTTPYDPATPHGYAYRTGPSATSGLPKEKVLRVWPNPAVDHITVSNPADNSADGYTIINILGQAMLSGSLHTGDQDVNISGLPCGSYIINLYHEGNEYGRHIFVKN